MIRKPITIALSILLVGIGLFNGMYVTIHDSFFKVIVDHEMRLMSTMEELGSKVVDAKLAELKRFCLDMLRPSELGLIPEDGAEIEALLREVALPERALNVAYLHNGSLICRDESFRGELEALDIASVAEKKDAVVFNPFFDKAGNYVLTVAAATQDAPGVFIVQYDGFCMSDWLNSTVSLTNGTAYIVDSEGYNIAAAGDEEEIAWITTRYNAQLLAEQDPTTENVSIAALEKKALAGETGVGSYEWENSDSYVAYGPLTEAPWGYYVGFYGTALAEYTQDVAAISGQAGIVLLLAFGIFMGCILALTIRSLNMERKYNQLILLQKAEAEKRSIRDSLTGVKNKWAWQEAGERLDKNIQAGTAKFAIVVCDVNGLKQVNDTLGHKAGDSLIIRASRYICKVFSHSPVYRIGGDEFTAILEGDDLADYERLLHEFDLGMTEQQQDNPAEPPISIALGIYHYQPGDTTFADVFHRADKAMYQKKTAMKMGR